MSPVTIAFPFGRSVAIAALIGAHLESIASSRAMYLDTVDWAAHKETPLLSQQSALIKSGVR